MTKKYPNYNVGKGVKFQRKGFSSSAELLGHFSRLQDEAIPDERDGIPIADKQFIAANATTGEGLYKATYLKPDPRYKERGTGEVYIEEEVYYIVDYDGNIRA